MVACARAGRTVAQSNGAVTPRTREHRAEGPEGKEPHGPRGGGKLRPTRPGSEISRAPANCIFSAPPTGPAARALKTAWQFAMM